MSRIDSTFLFTCARSAGAVLLAPLVALPVLFTPLDAAAIAKPRGAAAPAAIQTPLFDPVVLAAGDIADCHGRQPPELSGAAVTARLVERMPGSVLAVGDLVYPDGTATEFRDCYAPTWGRFQARTHPVPGNHEYHQPAAGPYFAWFGASAGEAGNGYYSFDRGAWHIIALNSNIDMSESSEQMAWLRRDLAAHRTLCTLAYWHHPRFSSGFHGNNRFTAAVWRTLYANGVDVVLGGHDHHYERFAPQDPDGRFDPARGIREFVVGTGGADRAPTLWPKRNSLVRNSGTFGVLRLTLRPAGYDWTFVPEPGKPFRDSGSGACHP